MDIPTYAEGLCISFTLRGAGRIGVDDAILGAVDPASVAVTPESETIKFAREKHSRDLPEAYPTLPERPTNLDFEKAALLVMGAVQSADDAVKAESKRTEGTWRAVSVTGDGKPWPDDRVKAITIAIKADGTWVEVGGKDKLEGTLSIDPGKSPKTANFANQSGKSEGFTSLEIYEIESDTMKPCFVSVPTGKESSKERPTKFATEVGSGHFSSVMKRDSRADEPPRYKVYAVRYGTLPGCPVSALLQGAEPQRKVDLAMTVWVLKGPDGRTVLVDAGFYRPQFFKEFEGIADYTRPDRAVGRLGIKPEEITDVIVTHMHSDHIDGVDLFPKATVGGVLTLLNGVSLWYV